MPFAEISLRVEREGGVGQGHAVEHADLVPGLVRVRHDLPVEGLIDDKIQGLRHRKARRADYLAANPGQNEMPGRPEHLFGQLAPFVNALLERFSFPDRFELLVDRGEAPRGLTPSSRARRSITSMLAAYWHRSIELI